MSSHAISVRHAGISVRNLEKALHFYQELLGLTVKTRSDERGLFLEGILAYPDAKVTTVKLGTESGPTLIELLSYQIPKPKEEPRREIYDFGPSHIAFTVDDIDNLYQKMIEAGVVFRSPPLQSPEGLVKVAFCADPDGTPVELVQHIA